jgi:hypothetical protein
MELGFYARKVYEAFLFSEASTHVSFPTPYQFLKGSRVSLTGVKVAEASSSPLTSIQRRVEESVDL